MRRINDDDDLPVYEVKAHDGPGWRLYGVREGLTWFFTHGRRKPGDNRVNQEAMRAREIFRDRRG